MPTHFLSTPADRCDDRIKEDGNKTLSYAHLFAFDHLVGTVCTAWFAVVWYMYTPHDGRRVANSDAQKEMLGDVVMDDATRIHAAQAIWKSERGFSAAVLACGWLIKVRANCALECKAG